MTIITYLINMILVYNISIKKNFEIKNCVQVVRPMGSEEAATGQLPSRVGQHPTHQITGATSLEDLQTRNHAADVTDVGFERGCEKVEGNRSALEIL